jgi:hypothetical protein
LEQPLCSKLYLADCVRQQGKVLDGVYFYQFCPSISWGINVLACRKRCTASHGHGHSSEICGPGNGVDGPGHLSCTYIGQYHAYVSHSSKRACHSISSGPDSNKPYRYYLFCDTLRLVVMHFFVIFSYGQ